jgi:hypothetical protein
VCCNPHRAAKTLMVYLMETNPTVYSWLVNYYKENTIPKVSIQQCKAVICFSLQHLEAGCCAQLPDPHDRLNTLQRVRACRPGAGTT